MGPNPVTGKGIVPRVNYAMDYRPKNSFSMSCASRMGIFPGALLTREQVNKEENEVL